MTLQDIIKEYLTRYNITGRTFAKKCGDRISYPYIANIIRGYSPSTGEPPKVSDDKLEIIAHGMDMTLEQLRAKMRDEKPIFLHQPPGPISLAPLADQILPSGMETFTYTPGRSMVPIVGSVRCGVGGLAYQDIQGSEVADVADPWHYFYLRVEGDSMAPAIEAGDLEARKITGVGLKTKVRRESAILLPIDIMPVVEDLVAHAQPSGYLWPRNEPRWYVNYYDALEAAGCRRLEPYCCRHTTATRLAVSEGIAPQTIQHIMRWSTTKMLDRYAHPDDAAVRAAVRAAADSITRV